MAGLTPTQRTLRALRQRGLVADIVERFLQYAGPHGIRKDLFGIIDVLALSETGVIGVQSCGQDFSQHWQKLTVERRQETSDWLSTPGTSLELWGWRKVKAKRGGLAMIWSPRVRPVTLLALEAADPGWLEDAAAEREGELQ